MRLLTAVVCSMALIGAIRAEKEKGKEKVKKDKNACARVVVTGTLLCAHCELGIGDSCCAAVEVGDVAFVIEGAAGDEIFDDRKSGILKTVRGSVSAKEGYLYVKGEKATDPKGKDAKPRSVLLGKLVKDGDALAIDGGIRKIRLTGKGTAGAAKLRGKRVSVAGVFSVDDDDEIVIKAKRIDRVVPKKKK